MKRRPKRTRYQITIAARIKAARVAIDKMIAIYPGPGGLMTAKSIADLVAFQNAKRALDVLAVDLAPRRRGRRG